MPEVLEKVQFAREVCERLNIRQGGVTAEPGTDLPPFDIQVDGGINLETARQCIEAGANVLVAGTYVFKQPDMAAAVRGLRMAAE